jgi:predicted lysophospholipase L1 biosynthesis ABC-type transport system permease subunit
VYVPFPPPTVPVNWSFSLEIWTAVNPELMMQSVRKVFQRAVPGVPLELASFEKLVDRQLLYERLLAAIAIGFAATGALMAAIGVYGVAAYTARRRRVEAGIRAALGATQGQIVWLFARQHLTFTAAGLALGVSAALGLTRFLQSWLFGISPTDAASFVLSLALLVLVSGAAALLPTISALQFPMWDVLRSE